MANEKERYEQQILQSKLFSLNCESEPNAYQREQLRMIENLYCYLMSIGREKYENYGLEITETAKRCIRGYDESKGQFLSYFLSSWKYEFSHLTSDRLIDEKLHGIKISEDDRRNVIRYIQFVNSSGTHCSLHEICQRLSVSMGLSTEEVERIASIEETTVSSDMAVDSDGNEFCILDQFASGNDLFEEIVGNEAVSDWLYEIDEVFSEIQERQKPIVTDLLTIKLCDQLPYHILSECQCRFLNSDIIETWHLTGDLPSQKEIAEKHKKKEASVSRSLREFCKKVNSVRAKGEKNVLC